MSLDETEENQKEALQLELFHKVMPHFFGGRIDVSMNVIFNLHYNMMASLSSNRAKAQLIAAMGEHAQRLVEEFNIHDELAVMYKDTCEELAEVRLAMAEAEEETKQ